MEYNDKLDPDQQITAEEKIAAHLFDNYREGFNEFDASEAGKEILRMVLEKFRTDLFV